jgi:hypothetical protein
MDEHIKWTEDARVQRFLAIGTVLSILLWIGSFFIIEDGARILSIPAYFFVSIGLVWLSDKYLFKEIDLIEEFKLSNPNVGLWLLSLSILVAAIISIIS